MSYTVPYFQAQIKRIANIAAKHNPTLGSQMTVMATALGTDTTARDATIKTAPGILRPGLAGNTRLHNDMALVINRGKGGNLTNAQMATAINTVAAGYPG
jgi:hypothetical protein